MKRRKKPAVALLRSLTHSERLRLALRAVARDDVVESRRIFESCPRRTYSMPEAEFMDNWSLVWKAAYHFRDAVHLLIQGRAFGEKQTLYVAQDYLDVDDYARFVRDLEESHTRVRNLQIPDCEPVQEAVPEALVCLDPNFATTRLELFAAFVKHYQLLASFVEGLRLLAKHLELTIEEVLAPVPASQRDEILHHTALVPGWVQVPTSVAHGMAELLAGRRLDDGLPSDAA